MLKDITIDTIRAGRERELRPRTPPRFLKAMRGFFGWAVETGLVATDPTKGVKMLAEKNQFGFHTWTEEELERFEAHWPLGTRERLAFDLLLYTGLRRGDAVRVGRQHVRDGCITIFTEKHRKGRRGEQVTIPILQPLAELIAATKTGDLTFLVTEFGRPWGEGAIGNWFKDVCRTVACPVRLMDCARQAQRARQSVAQRNVSPWRSSAGRVSGWQRTILDLPIEPPRA